VWHQQVDEDGNGELDIEELDMILKNKGVFMTQEKLEELFVKVDLDSESRPVPFYECRSDHTTCFHAGPFLSDTLVYPSLCDGR